MAKAAIGLKNLVSSSFGRVRPLSEFTFKFIGDELQKEVFKFARVTLPDSIVLGVTRGFLTDPTLSPFSNALYGPITSVADAEKECLSRPQKRYDPERKFVWHFQCETNSYYRYVPEKKKFLRYTEDAALCHSDETFECVSSLSFSFPSIEQ